MVAIHTADKHAIELELPKAFGLSRSDSFQHPAKLTAARKHGKGHWVQGVETNVQGVQTRRTQRSGQPRQHGTVRRHCQHCVGQERTEVSHKIDQARTQERLAACQSELVQRAHLIDAPHEINKLRIRGGRWP